MNAEQWFEFEGSKWVKVNGIWFDSFAFKASSIWQVKLDEAYFG